MIFKNIQLTILDKTIWKIIAAYETSQPFTQLLCRVFDALEKLAEINKQGRKRLLRFHGACANIIQLRWALQHDIVLALSLPLIASIGYGWLRLFLRRRGEVECGLPLALIFLLISRSGAVRYLISFIPFLFYYLQHGLNELGQRLPQYGIAARVSPYVLLMITCTAFAWHLAVPDRLRFVTSDSKDYRDIALWAGANLFRNAVVLAPFAHRFLAVSGLPAWPIDRLPELPRIIQQGNRPLYLLCAPDEPAERCAGLSTPVQRRGKTTLHLIQP